ncbi:MAG TPA: arsenic resistance N-acetyltransferase ArsN2 [Mucilaginibacter sp.]
MIIEKAQSHRKAVVELLSAEKLPVADLPETLENFIVAIADAEVIGVAGFEVYGNYGLLRSVAVRSDFRSKGIAGNLLRKIDELSSLKGLTGLYLLTETAPDYFERKGFQKIGRDEVPDIVKQSSEFSHVCPVSAIVMYKAL